MPWPSVVPERSCGPAHRQVAEQYAIAARLYAEAVVNLTKPSSNGGHSEGLDQLREAAESARFRCEAERVAFESSPPCPQLRKRGPH